MPDPGCETCSICGGDDSNYLKCAKCNSVICDYCAKAEELCVCRRNWTRFWDMHSGGRPKLDYEFIFIEAKIQDAIKIFYKLYSRNPQRITCTCCGPDYAIDEFETFEQASKITAELDSKYEVVPRGSFPKDWESVEVPFEGYKWV